MDPATPNMIKDGGWGWVIVAAVAFINMTNQSLLSVFGLLFGSQLQRMDEGTFTAALITNLNSVALNFSGLFIGPAIKMFAPRNVAVTGCILVSFGMLLCAYATVGWHYLVGYSFCVGLGLGLISPSTFVAINSYFSTKRGRAVGFSLAGSGLGQVFMPHLVRYLLDNYGARLAMLAMSMIALSGVSGALLLRRCPTNEAPIKNIVPPNMPLLTSATDDGEKQHLQININASIAREKIVPSKPRTTVIIPTPQKLCQKVGQRLVLAMDLALLLDPIFWSLIVGMALVYTSTVNFTMLFPHFLQYSLHMSTTYTASMMSVIAGADILCRLLLPCLTDRLRIPYRMIFLAGTAVLLVARAALAEASDLTSIVVLSILIGMAKSATVLNNNLAITAHCSPQSLAGGLGLNMVAKGVLVITVGQLLGWIRDATNSYVLCLHAQNLLLLVVVLWWSLEMCFHHRPQHNSATEEVVDGEISNKLIAAC